MSIPRWQRRSEGSNWNDWGAEDQCGRRNVRTSEKRMLGFAEVKDSIAVNLSLPFSVTGAVRSPANAIGTV